MAPKRKYQEPEAEDGVHASRQLQVYGNKPRPAKKPRNSEPARRQLHASSVNAIKKKIRDVSRRLERSETVPADIRVQDERALATYEQELAEAEAEKTRQKLIKKYHMVRFFGMQIHYATMTAYLTHLKNVKRLHDCLRSFESASSRRPVPRRLRH